MAKTKASVNSGLGKEGQRANHRTGKWSWGVPLQRITDEQNT